MAVLATLSDIVDVVRDNVPTFNTSFTWDQIICKCCQKLVLVKVVSDNCLFYSQSLGYIPCCKCLIFLNSEPDQRRSLLPGCRLPGNKWMEQYYCCRNMCHLPTLISDPIDLSMVKTTVWSASHLWGTRIICRANMTHTMAQPYQGFWWVMGQPIVRGVSRGY